MQNFHQIENKTIEEVDMVQNFEDLNEGLRKHKILDKQKVERFGIFLDKRKTWKFWKCEKYK